MAFGDINTAKTLSLRFQPGQDKRLANSKSKSIFTFGDFRVENTSSSDILTGSSKNLSFSSYYTLESLNAVDTEIEAKNYVFLNELNPQKRDPQSYSYFGSFYTEAAIGINKIIENFPYAILSYDNDSGTTIYDYSNYVVSGRTFSRFKIPFSSITNQGEILINSASTYNNSLSLLSNTDKFTLQLSGSSSNPTHNILAYHFSGSPDNYMSFTANGYLLSGSPGTTSVHPLYIRPSRKRYNAYLQNLTPIEKQLLITQELYVPNVNNSDIGLSGFTWPRTIDGFNPDISGESFEDYKTELLNAAIRIDESKTNYMFRTFVGDNFKEFDSSGEIAQSLLQVYAHEFDQLKKYIDNIAYAHTVELNGEESIPKKFLFKLSQLLGWELSDSFNELDFFEYLAGDIDSSGNSYSDYNLELWRRILANISWLYKKKGTRDALSFIFKLVGAPDCLIAFDEFVYTVNQTTPITTTISSSTQTIVSANKINSETGYPNYKTGSKYIFQEGGQGRGNGQNYINQWRPEFDPEKVVDNIKISTGATDNIMNSKEICVSLDPAKAVECDVKSWYSMSSTTCWNWGSTGSTLVFSSLTVPFEYLPDNCETVNPSLISGLTVAQYVDYIFKSNVNPTNRKTNNQAHTHFPYPELKKIYMNYYLSSTPTSNKLTIQKLEGYLRAIELQLQDYIAQLIPATTILACQGTLYRNPVFHRQRFVYKEGINRGSEFRNEMPPNIIAGPNPIGVSAKINEPISPIVQITTVNASISNNTTSNVNSFNISANVNTGINPSLPTASVGSTAKASTSQLVVGSGTLGGSNLNSGGLVIKKKTL